MEVLYGRVGGVGGISYIVMIGDVVVVVWNIQSSRFLSVLNHLSLYLSSASVESREEYKAKKSNLVLIEGVRILFGVLTR